jgi:hypothetical protein
MTSERAAAVLAWLPLAWFAFRAHTGRNAPAAARRDRNPADGLKGVSRSTARRSHGRFSGDMVGRDACGAKTSIFSVAAIVLFLARLAQFLARGSMIIVLLFSAPWRLVLTAAEFPPPSPASRTWRGRP